MSYIIVHSPVKGHLSCFDFLAIENGIVLLYVFSYESLHENVFLFLLDIFLQVKLLNLMVDFYLTAKVFSIMAIQL